MRFLANAIVITPLIVLSSALFAQSREAVMERMAEGVWAYIDADGEVVVSGSFLGVPPDTILRPDALAARRSFDFRTQDPVLGCGEPGMPRAFTAGSPMTFSWAGDDLVINYESMDVERIVRMNAAPANADSPRSPNGYARGRWEDEELVIETTHLDRRVVDLLGTPKSDSMTLEERYRIDEGEGETYLDVDLRMTDPETFSEPYLWRFRFVLRPDWELLEYDCVERPEELTPGVVPE